MMIPDLRSGDAFTIEHASILLERLQRALGEIHPEGPEEFAMIRDAMNPEDIKDDILEMFTEEAFSRLFSTEFGKGVLVGAFAQKFLSED